MNINGLNIDFHVAPQNYLLPYDGILGIKILTEQKLRLDESYLQINNNKIKLKPAHKLNHNLNIVTENPQKTDREWCYKNLKYDSNIRGGRKIFRTENAKWNFTRKDKWFTLREDFGK